MRCGLSSRPVAARQRGHAAEQALGGAAHQPDRAVALDPLSDAVLMRTDGALSALGKALGIAAGEGGAVVAQRAGAAARVASAGRSSRRGPSSPGRSRPGGRPAVIASASRSISGCDGGLEAVQPRDHAFDIGVDRGDPLAERDRRDCRRRIGADARAAREARRRSSGKPPRRATSRAQAMRLRARA